MLINSNQLKTFYNALIQKIKGFRGNWNQNDPTADDYIKNKPFYEEKKIVNEPLYLTWNDAPSNPTLIDNYFYKISDIVLTDEQIKSSIVGFFGEKWHITDEAWDFLVEEGLVQEDIVNLDWAIVIVRATGATSYDISFPETGIYFGSGEFSFKTTCPIKQEKTIIHKLDKKYIDMPDDIVTEDDVYDIMDDNLAYVAFSGDYNSLYNKPDVYNDVVRYGKLQSLGQYEENRARANIKALSQKDIYNKKNKTFIFEKATVTEGVDTLKCNNITYYKISDVSFDIYDIVGSYKAYYDNRVSVFNGATRSGWDCFEIHSFIVVTQAIGDCSMIQGGVEWIQAQPPSTGIYAAIGSSKVEITVNYPVELKLPSNTEGSHKTFLISSDDNGTLSIKDNENIYNIIASNDFVIEKANSAETNANNYTDGRILEEANIRETGDTNTLNSAKAYADEEIAKLVNSAPETLDTLGELATAFQENKDVVDALDGAITNKADKTDVLIKTTQTLTDEELTQVRSNLKFIGKDVEGQTFTVDGETLTASANAEIFGDYENNIAIGQWSIAEGSQTIAKGRASHAEGAMTQALNDGTHTEGYQTKATGYWSHAEGEMTTVSSYASHAEGSYCTLPDGTKRYGTASGYASHVEGGGCHTTGSCSHAEGLATTASGAQSHVEGRYTIAASGAQHVEGTANIEDTDDTYIHIAGNGSFDARSNAYTLDWVGNAWFSGDVYVGSTSGINKDEGSKKLATEEYVDIRVPAWTDADEGAILQIVNGKPTWVKIPNAEEASF